MGYYLFFLRDILRDFQSCDENSDAKPESNRKTITEKNHERQQQRKRRIILKSNTKHHHYYSIRIKMSERNRPEDAAQYITVSELYILHNWIHLHQVIIVLVQGPKNIFSPELCKKK